jgi:hypothetical protein
MRRQRMAVAAGLVAALGTTSGLAAPAQARVSGTPGWRIVKVIARSRQSVVLNDVVSTGSRSAWAAGDFCPPCNETNLFVTGNLLLERWSGNTWSRVRPPQRLLNGAGSYATMDASSATNLWIIGGSQPPAILLRYNGVKWARIALPAPPAAEHNYGGGSTAYAFGPEDIWFFVGDFAFHFVHHHWQLKRLPAALRSFGNVSFVSSTDIWALGRYSRRSAVSGNRYAAMHWNGRSWSVVSLGAIKLPSPTKYRLGPTIATGPRDLWVVGNLVHAPFLLHWAGSATGWSRVDLPPGSNTVYGMTQDGHGGLWLYVYREDQTWQFDHYSAGAWTQQPVPTAPGGTNFLYSLSWIPGTHSVWAVGQALPSATATKYQAVILKYGP